MSVAALVMGAGSGSRLQARQGGSGPGGDSPVPKALVPLLGIPLIARSLGALSSVAEIDRLIPVIPESVKTRWAEVAAGFPGGDRLVEPVVGGAERQDSVRAGLAALPADVTHVAVHDAARPLLAAEDARRVVAAGLRSGAAILAVPAADTIKRVRDGCVVDSPPRAECWAAQTPQVFRVDWLREAHAKAQADGFAGTDDAELVGRLGVAVDVVRGDPGNFKVTVHGDLVAAEALLRAAGEAGR